ncbi:MAG TPA: PPC domain-containing DNA-binding protein, partial [Pyrinomonadaceae bacterium]
MKASQSQAEKLRQEWPYDIWVCKHSQVENHLPNTFATGWLHVGQQRAEARPIGAGRVKAPPTRSAVESRRLRILAIRLRPGQDLRQAIEELVKARKMRAGFILTAVGSMQNATIRLADQKEPTTFAGKFEIVSLVGTMGQDGIHLHISIADSDGKTIGGHLVDGCLIYTTAEIVIGEAQGLTFSREQNE